MNNSNTPQLVTIRHGRLSIQRTFSNRIEIEDIGTVYYQPRDEKRPVLIIVPGPPTTEEEIEEFTEFITSLGFVCIIPRIIRTNCLSEEALEINTNQLSKVIKELEDCLIESKPDESLEKNQDVFEELSTYIKSAKIGLIGYSEGSEICANWSQKNKKKKVDGIFLIAPVSTICQRTLFHPLFLFIGNIDATASMNSWDRSNVAKTGIILRGGRHGELFRPRKKEERSKNSSRNRQGRNNDSNLEEFEQSQILLECVYLFFAEIFSPKKLRNQYDVIKYLKLHYQEQLRLLYHIPLKKKEKLVIEGTYLETKDDSIVDYECWIGNCYWKPNQGSLNSDYSFLSSGRFLYSGIKDVFKVGRFSKYKLQVWKYRQLLESNHSNEKNSTSKVSIVVEEIIAILRNVVGDPLKNQNGGETHLPIPIHELPLVEEIEKLIDDTISKQSSIAEKDRWTKLKNFLEVPSFSSFDFLINIIRQVRLSKIDPWDHTAYGREIIWRANNFEEFERNEDEDAKCKFFYEIDLGNFKTGPVDSRPYKFVSLRLGQSYKSRFKTQGNALRTKQSIDIFFNDEENKSFSIQVLPPLRRRPRVAEPIDMLEIKEFLFGNWIDDIGLQCYLSHYLIPIPYQIETIKKIKLCFLNPSGAIMLSEVALTN